MKMNISKIKLGWKFLTGGPTGALDCANSIADLIGALEDMRLTQDELRQTVDTFRVAYAAWRAE